MHGRLEIPIVDGPGLFAWGVWVSLSQQDFDRACDLWDDPNRVNEPPSFGLLANSVPGFPETLQLKTTIHARPVGIRPGIELEPADNPLILEQRNGITMARVREIVEMLWHHG